MTQNYSAGSSYVREKGETRRDRYSRSDRTRTWKLWCRPLHLKSKVAIQGGVVGTLSPQIEPRQLTRRKLFFYSVRPPS